MANEVEPDREPLPKREEVRATWSLLSATLTLLLIIAIVFILWVGRTLLIPFAIAIIIWYLISALARLIGRIRVAGHTIHGWPATALSVIILLMTVALTAQQIGNSVLQMRDAAPSYATNAQALLDELARLFGFHQGPRIGALLDEIDLRALATGVAGALANIAGSAGIIFIYVVFLLFEQAVFERKLAAMVRDEARHARLRAIIGRVQHDVQTYLLVKTLTSFMTGLISYVILAAFGVDYAGFWGFLIFLLNYIPTIGSLIGVMFPAAMTVLQFGALYPFLPVVILLSITQMVIGNFVEPRLMGRSLNISPLVVMMSLIAWGLLWGVTGMVLSVPLMVILLITLANFQSTRPIAVLMSATGRVPSVEQGVEPEADQRRTD